MASWTRIENSGQEARFELFNLHGEDDIARAEAFLRGSGLAGDGPSLLLLSADGRGAGRRFFLDAVAWRLRHEPAPPRIWHLDLAGFEPDRPNALGAYLAYQLERRGLDREDGVKERWAELAKMLSWPPNDVAAILVALLLEVEDPRQALAGLEELAPWEILEKLLEVLSAEHTVVLHLVDFAQAPEPLRRRLTDLAERRPRFFAAFSCFGEAAENVAPDARHEVFRHEIEPLSQDELRLEITRRFTPEDFPESLADVLWRQTGGAPALAGSRLAELEEDGLLPPASAADAAEEALAGQIGNGLQAILDDNGELGNVLRSLLLYGSVCGEAFPPMLLLELMGVDEETADEVVDLVDATLAEGLGWIDDLEFRHPGFPGMQIYRFAEPALAATILHKVGAENASAAASELLDAFEQRLPAFTRAAGHLHLALSRQLGPAYQRPHLERLAWWVGPEDAAELSALVKRKIESGELGFEILWKVLRSQGPRWPPFRRLALLEASRPQLEAAYRLNPSPELAEACALLLANEGEHAKARELQGSVIEASSRQFGEKHPATLAAIEALALSFFAEKQFDLARDLHDQVLEGRRETYGPDHPETLASLWNLAVTMSQQGEADLAKAMLEKAAADMKRVFGPRHPISQAVDRWLLEKRTT